MESIFFIKFVNQTRKTLETDESEARDLESENLKFVEFGVQFVRKIRKIRLQISGVVPLHGSYKAFKSAIETWIEEARGGKGKRKGEEVILKATRKAIERLLTYDDVVLMRGGGMRL